jgi:hypothetical protein
MKKSKGLARLESPERRTVLERILDAPNLEQIVPRLQPEVLHRVIQSCGLEDCGEFVMLATPAQLTRIFDLDLWRAVLPGMDEQFDADRFGVWLEVLAEFDVGMAAHKLAEMDPDLVIAGLAQHARVLDCAVVTPYRTTDGVELTATRELDQGLASEIGGYRLIAKRNDSWEAIVAILMSLDEEHSDYFHQVMRGCRALSNSGYERDGLHDLLAAEDQIMFDLALDREGRRDKRGYVPAPQARAFLESSRRLALGSGTMPAADPVARAYFRSFKQTTTAQTAPQVPASKRAVLSENPVEGTAALLDVLIEAGIITQQPRALLTGSQREPGDNKGTLRLIRSHMQFILDGDHAVYAGRNEELTYIANTIMAGCSLQHRPFTAQEAWDAAVAVCNLGLENWPPLWHPAKSLPDDFLVDHDLVTVFQVGWTVLYRDVSMYAAEHLLAVLAAFRCHDYHVRAGLDELRTALSNGCRAGLPWRAREALEVIAILDMPAWTALLGLISECPVLHAALGASRNRGTHSVSASAFDFISENSQITSIREFIQSLPETLRSS